MEKTVSVKVRVLFGQNIVMQKSSIEGVITVKADGSDSIQELKTKIATAFGGTLTKDHLMIYFGPNERQIGRQYQGDPGVDEATQQLKEFSVLSWLERFPHWFLSVKLMPGAPPPPGVATHKAAAIAEGKDPEQAVIEARAKGEIPALSELPSPWGPQKYIPSERDAEDLPVKFPKGFSPLSDQALAL